jgi:Prokaryotic phospholipase A2
MPTRTGAHGRAGLISLLTVAVLAVSASAAQALAVPGTAAERANTTTPGPPGGDQCSFSPDTIAGIVDFSVSCYGHDLCWQNNSYNGRSQTETSCNEIFRDNLRQQCDEQNTGFGSSIPEGVCMSAAQDYYTAVSAVSRFADVGAPGG